MAAARRQVADRENLPGVNALLDALSRTLAAASEQRRAEGTQLQSLSADEQNDLAENATISQGQLQDTLGVYLSAIGITHGNDFDMLIRPLRRMVKAVVPDSEVVFQPSEDYYYRASLDLIQVLEAWAINNGLEDVHDDLRSLPRVIVIEYPAISESDVLQHAHIGHELSHLILNQPDPDAPDKVRSDALFERHLLSVEDDLKRTRRAHLKNAPQKARDAYAYDRERFGKWLLEFSVDALALHLVGPWFFFALTEFAHVDGNWHTHPELRQQATHPHLAWRLAHLADATRVYFRVAAAEAELDADERLDDEERGGALGLVREGLGLVKRIKRWLPTIPKAEIALERRLIDPAVAELHANAGTILKGARYSPEQFWIDLAPVAQKLKAGIPPAERIDSRRRRDVIEDVPWQPREDHVAWSRDTAWSSPLDWRSIVNGSYLHWLLREDPSPAIANDWGSESPVFLPKEMREASDSRRDINAAVRGSVELSELLLLAHERREDSLPLERPPHALA